MMGKRQSANDDTSSNDECELKAMLIDKCKMCHANLDTDQHQAKCDHNDRRNPAGERREEECDILLCVIKLFTTAD